MNPALKRFHGSITALITPFRDGAFDRQAFDRLVETQIKHGTHGLVACGTTGESPTVTEKEHLYIVERCVAIVKGRVPVIAGTGSNSTAEAIAMTKFAQEAGADAALIVVPYYNKPTQEGLYAHYRAIHDATNIPIILYNVPARSVVDLNVETTARLASLPRIIGIKDAAGDPSRVSKLRALVGEDFLQFAGDDALALAFLEQGAHGNISVASNVAPAECAQMHDAWQAGDRDTARALDERLKPLYKALFFETSPAPVKYAGMKLGLCTDEVRLPLVPASEACRKAVDDAMTLAGLLEKKIKLVGVA